PVANQLFDFAIRPDGSREERKLRFVHATKEDWDKDNPDGPVEQFIAFALTLPRDERECVVWYITRRLSEPFIWREYAWQRQRRHVLMFDENRRFEINGVLRAKHFLDNFPAEVMTGIVTTNYDTLIEYAFGTGVFNYGTI